jgi:hypothetical protein
MCRSSSSTRASTRSATTAPPATRSAAASIWGPICRDVATTRDREWLSRFIVDPEQARAAGDPIALALRAKYKQVVMPSLDLGPADAAVLIDYIDQQSRAMRAAAETPGATAAGGRRPVCT